MGRTARFFKGVGYLFRGMGTLLAGPGLLRWGLLPVGINSLVFLALAVLAAVLAGHYGGQAAEGTWGAVLGWLAGVVAFLVVVVIGSFTFGMIAVVIAAPFNEVLSQKTERLLTGSTGEVKDRSLAADMARAGLAAVKLFALEMLVILPALLLLLLPVIGAVLFAVPAGFFLAMAYLDYPLDRRKLRLRDKLAFCRRHGAEVMGFGLAVYAAMLVPFVNVLMIPAAAVGATRLYLDAAAGERAGSPAYSPGSPADPEGPGASHSGS